ncbi:MAG: hypothetical protein A2039_05095 [Candidatus Melainabacteria bacterium GWA2_34_9]|nr:MAG: hypothetical protein A2039_05095 [Candidatus Melainabacteria bacterium GWA2_34_9]
MNLIQKLKSYERKIVFMRWEDTEEYGRIKYVGRDFIEFEIIDREDLDYHEVVLVNPSLIFEVIIASPDLDRVVVEVCSNLPSLENKKNTEIIESEKSE